MEQKASEEVIPLSKRLYDLFFIFAFIIFLYVAYTIDIVSGIGSIGRGSAGVTAENTKHFIWPPQFMIQNVLWWCEVADPVFCHNPVWMKVMAWVSPFIYGPFYLFAIYAFIKGRNWIRVPGLMYGWGLFYTVSIIFAEEYMGEHPALNFPAVFWGNFPWWFIPFLLMIRLARPNPFTRAKKSHQA